MLTKYSFHFSQLLKLIMDLPGTPDASAARGAPRGPSTRELRCGEQRRHRPCRELRAELHPDATKRSGRHR